MNDIIPLHETYMQQKQVRTVNARDLHAFLGVKRGFNNWINDRIEQYGFIEENDFTTVLFKSTGGRPAKEYHITIGMAKELSMVEKTPKGKEARLYFIRKEEENNDLMKKLDDPVFLRGLLGQKNEQLMETQGKLNEAIRTKAYISDKKTASAMGTASGAVRRANKLERENEKLRRKDEIRQGFKKFYSKFSSTCDHCHCKIHRGNAVWGEFFGKNSWGDVVHERCFDEYLSERASATDAFDQAIAGMNA